MSSSSSLNSTQSFETKNSEKNNPQKKKSKKKKNKKRCAHPDCKKKLNLTDWACKCNKKFCSVHKPINKHDCSFDWKMQQFNFLKENLDKAKSIDTKNFVSIC